MTDIPSETKQRKVIRQNAEILALQARLVEAEAEIERLKTINACPECGMALVVERARAEEAEALAARYREALEFIHGYTAVRSYHVDCVVNQKAHEALSAPVGEAGP